MTRTIVSIIVMAWVIMPAAAPGAAAPAGDAYIEGYAAAVLAERFGRSPGTLRVKDGVITLAASDLAGLDRDAVVAALRSIPGVARVDVTDTAGVKSVAPPAPSTAGAPVGAEAPPAPPGAFELVSRSEFQTGWMPGGLLFWPLIADPRWPHFSATYQHYLDDPDVGDVGAVSFGETFTLHRWHLAPHWLEIGVQAGVFAIFDLNADFDLINADYFVAAVLGYRWDKLSALARVFHQSSHLGDEFLLTRSNVNRVNLSYEGIDARISYELWDDVLRPYVGGGYLFRRDPTGLEPWSVQYGLEFRWPGREARIRPIAAVDLQHREENEWGADFSLRAGVQIGSTLQARAMQILLEYFSGHSPNGQFYERKIEYLGLGVHFHF
ncbi:MAG: DUF1207 domain-containing protein [Candidatus Rokuibacteriota bacterium]